MLPSKTGHNINVMSSSSRYVQERERERGPPVEIMEGSPSPAAILLSRHPAVTPLITL